MNNERPGKGILSFKYFLFQFLSVRMKTEFGTTLTLNNLSKENNLYFTCVSFNNFGTTTQEFDIRVRQPNFKPTRNASEFQNFQLKIGTTASINCEIFGKPAPEINWKFKGNDIYAHSIYFVRNDGHTLVFNVENNNQGVFTCEAVNELGKASIDFTVTIESKFLKTT